MFPKSWVTPGAKIDKNSDVRPMLASPVLAVVLYDPAIGRRHPKEISSA